MKLTAQISIGIIVVIACFFLFRGCQQGKALQVIQDSLNREKAFNDTIKWEHAKVIHSVDSVVAKNSKDSLIYNRKIDSQSRIIASLQGRFKISKDSIFTLYGQLKTFYDSHDTVSLLNTYTELRNQLTTANNLLFSISLSRDSLEHTSKNETDRLNGLITQLKGQIDTLNALLIQCTDNGASLAKNADKALKKARSGNLLTKVGATIAAILAILFITK